MNALTLYVSGLPRPQGSMRAMTVGGRARIFHADHDDLAVWRGAITHDAAALWGQTPPLDGPVFVHLYFYLPRPASAPKRRQRPDRRPDLDKLARAVLDSLTGVVFTDDARVVQLLAGKYYASDEPPGVRIQCGPLETEIVPGPGPIAVGALPEAGGE